jgi:chromosome segregation ATPase
MGFRNLREALGQRVQHEKPRVGNEEDIAFMRILLRARTARIGELEKEVSELSEALGRPRAQIGAVNSDVAFLNDTVATLTAAVAERDARIAALKSKQVAGSGTLAVRQSDLARAIAETEAQRKNVGTLEAALAAANTRLAEEQTTARAALELRTSMEAAIEERHRRIAQLEGELAVVVRDRDASVTAAAAVQAENAQQASRLEAANARALELESNQVAESGALAARQSDLARAIAETEAQRKDLGKLETALAAANTRLAEEEAATLSAHEREQATARAALELRTSMEAAIEERHRRIAQLEGELAVVVRDRDASVTAAAAVQAENAQQASRLETANARALELESHQAAESGALAVRQSDLARALAETEAQRKNVGTLEAALVAANTRLAEEEAAALAALELRTSMEAAIEERCRRIAQLEGELAALARDRDASVAAAAAVQAENIEQAARLETANARALGLESHQVAESGALAARQSDLARALAETEAQRRDLGKLEAALAAANTRLAEEEAATLAAHERRESMEAVIEEQYQRIAHLEVELATVARDRDASVAAAAAVQAENIEQAARLVTVNAGMLELEAEALDQARAGTALTEEPRLNLERGRDPVSVPPAAEDSTHRSEAKGRKESSCLDERPTPHDDSRDTNGTPEVAREDAAPLFIRTGESEVVHVLGSRTTIGRTRENDLQIDAKYISRHHAVIFAGPTHTIIEDLNSTNGVIVNGRRVLRQTLRDGDIVLIGAEPFRYAVRPAAEGR